MKFLPMLALLLAVRCPASAQEEDSVATPIEVHWVEARIRYGSEARQDWKEQDDWGLSSPGLIVRAGVHEVSGEEPLRLARNVCYFTSDEDESLDFIFHDQNRRPRARHIRWRGMSHRLRPRTNMRVVSRVHRSRNPAGGGDVRLGFVVARRTDAPEIWDRGPDSADPRDILLYAIRRIEGVKRPSREVVDFVTRLATIVPLTETGMSERRIERILETATESKRMFGPGGNHPLITRIRVRAGLDFDPPEEPLKWLRRQFGFGELEYAWWRHVSENPAYGDTERAYALAQCIGVKGDLGAHDYWIDELESGRIRMPPVLRTRILESLHFERLGRNPMPLVGFAAGAMLALIAMLIVYRLVARRVLFR